MALRVVGSSPITHPDLKGGIAMSRYDWNLNEEEAEMLERLAGGEEE